jgi:hypothetical protein
MTDTETNFDDAASETKPRKSRKRSDERRVFFYEVINGKPKELGAFPETAIGTLSERSIASFAKDFFREGDIRAEVRKANGHFERAFDFSIAETEKPSQEIIEVEPEEFDDAPEEFSFDNNAELSHPLQLQLLIEKEKTKRLETELNATKAGSQNEMQTTVSALERAYEQNRELMMMMVVNAQKPLQDSSTQAINMMEKAFGIVNRAKTISDNFSPSETSDGGGGSMISDAAKLVDSFGRHAPTIIPMLGGLLGGGGISKTTVRPTRAQNATTNGADGQGSNLADLARKIQEKENIKK